MPDGLDRQVGDLNDRDAGRLAEFAERNLGPSGARTLGALRELGAGAGLRDGLEVTARSPIIGLKGARAFVDLLEQHPALSDGRELEIGIAAFGNADDDPALFAARRDAAELLVLGALSLGALGRVDEPHIGGLLHVAIGAEAFSRGLREILLGKPFPNPDDWPRIPDWLGHPKLDHRLCVTGVLHALTEFGKAAAGSVARGFSTGIAALSPNVGCSGQAVEIQGSGFGGSQPTGVQVYFPMANGRCAQAQVQSWSDTKIVATAPQGVGTGCVGFVELPTGGGLMPEAAAQLAGELEGCFGMAASNVASKLHTLPMTIVPCPPCLSGQVNRFSGGLPAIQYFSVNGSSQLTVQPGSTLNLAWDVRGATGITIARTSAAGPAASPPSPVPAIGTLALGPFNGTMPATASYKITATNSCGSVSRTITVVLRKDPALSVTRIEVVQAIQRTDNSVRLVARKRTVVRVFVESGITGGFDNGAGPNLQPNVNGRVTVWPAGAGQGFGGFGPLNPGGSISARPAATMQRQNGTHSLNFELPVNSLTAGQARVDARVWVSGHENDPPGAFAATGSATVDFLAQPTQEVLPFLIADPALGNPAPTLAQYNGSLQGARSRFPIAEDGFIVNPPIGHTTTPLLAVPRDLTGTFGWGLLLGDLATMIFLFPSTPVGGIRTGVVPADTRYALNGMAVPRVALSIPSQLSQRGLQGTFAHEMGHAFGLGHANCCLPPGEAPDTRLPAGTDDVGMDVPNGNVIEAGRGELMSYCGDTSRCPGTTRWPSTAFWDFVFGRIPI